MRTKLFTTGLIMGLFLLVGCDSSIVRKRATGLPYEVVVVMSQEVGQSEVGELIKEQLNSIVPGLPQAESSMRVTFVPEKSFDGLLMYVRNILIVDINPSKYTIVSVNQAKDEWADNQEVVRLSAPSIEEMVTYLTLHDRDIVNHFSLAERERQIAVLKKYYSTLAMEKIQEKFNLSLHAPEDMTYYRDTTNFLWFSNNAATGRIDLMVYSFPYTDANTFTEEYLVAKRDSVLKANLPGAFPNSYVTTEKRAGVTFEPITLNNKYCGTLRGLWKMVGDKMGGPFVSHAFLDQLGQRVIVTEGFVYAPEMEKRNLIRRIEAALYTAQLQDSDDMLIILETPMGRH